MDGVGLIGQWKETLINNDCRQEIALIASDVIIKPELLWSVVTA